MLRTFSSVLTWILVIVVSACGDQPWNLPYSTDEQFSNTLYSSFESRPKHLDPARSYASNEVEFTGQVYEPPLQYHYLDRPYRLIPLTARRVPEPYFLDERGAKLPADAPEAHIAFSVYEVEIQAGIQYQPHPAFAEDADGNLLNMDWPEKDLARIRRLSDFTQTGTRELIADDYVYQIKRLAHPKLQSPILGLMTVYIDGLSELNAALTAELKRDPNTFIDLRDFPLRGAESLDRYRYRITLKGRYPQFLYWLAMPFFAPIPYEADQFYAQPGLASQNINFNWYPVGTGPFMLTRNDPNLEMVLERNPNFHGEAYPAAGEPGDEAAGLLRDAGAPLPFLDRAVYKLEKESIPYWNKFLQGYYDTSGLSSDSFDQAVRIAGSGEAQLTEDMLAQGIRMVTSVGASTYYVGFNMLDPLVGGDSERARKLRQAISIGVDYEEFISIFLNGRGVPAHGPIPPGVFGHNAGTVKNESQSAAAHLEIEAGFNPVTHEWIGGKIKRKSIAQAHQLLVEAGYPNGVDAQTGQPLVLNFDVTATSGPDEKAQLDWWRKAFKQLNIELVIRATDYNRFQDKMSNGNAQIFKWGWLADYPDPENFMFLLYGPHGKVKYQGENAANYTNGEFDRLFDQMKMMSDSPQRLALIARMLAMVREDAPWLWGYHPTSYGLYHSWFSNAKPNQMANNTLKYKRIDPMSRAHKRAEWNQPIVWPLWIGLGVVGLLTFPAFLAYRRRLWARAS